MHSKEKEKVFCRLFSKGPIGSCSGRCCLKRKRKIFFKTVVDKEGRVLELFATRGWNFRNRLLSRCYSLVSLEIKIDISCDVLAWVCC